MPDISFYILSTDSEIARHLFVCKLIEKAYRLKQFCYVYTDTQQQSHQLDELLWRFRAGSFIPHQVFDGSIPDYKQTTLIGTLEAPENWQKTIINISSNYPDNLEHTQRVLEILDNDKQIKQQGRLRYRQYNQAGYKLITHTHK